MRTDGTLAEWQDARSFGFGPVNPVLREVVVHVTRLRTWCGMDRAIRAPALRCAGRMHCAHMAACAQVRCFPRHCPDVRMDGDGHGEPCERPRCTTVFSP
jgi:hypothetical protein